VHPNSKQVSITSAGSQVGQAVHVGSHVGPCAQRSEDLSCSAVIPLVKRSAERLYLLQLEIAQISLTL